MPWNLRQLSWIKNLRRSCFQSRFSNSVTSFFTNGINNQLQKSNRKQDVQAKQRWMSVCHQYVQSDTNVNEETARPPWDNCRAEKEFGPLFLIINKTKGQETELIKLSEEVLRPQTHQSTASSILNRQTTLITRPNEMELQFDLLDDDAQLSQSSSRISNDKDVSLISSGTNLSRQSTLAPSDDNEQIQHQRALEEKQTRSNIFNQPPPIPPRPMQPPLFLLPSRKTGPQIQHVLEAHQKNPIKAVNESLLKSKNNLENQSNTPNPITCSDKETGQKFTSLTKSGELIIASNLVNRDVREKETAQFNWCNNFNT